ncbi:MAG: hypothetical protein ABIH00_06445 [Armatimonadota bacterium]
MYSKWEEKLKRKFGKEYNLSSVRFFESKKNQVALVEIIKGEKSFTKKISFVIKYFVWGDRKLEESILKKSEKHGIAVPKIIGSEKNILFLENIPGENLRTLYNKLPDIYHGKAENYDRLTASWLALFHKTFRKKDKKDNKVLLKGDMRPQNFILYGGSIYGVDFEESAWGAPEYDIADLFAAYLTQAVKHGKKTYKEEMKKYKKRTDKFIDIYSKISGIKLNKDINKLVSKELIKRTKYTPHLKDELMELAEIVN